MPARLLFCLTIAAAFGGLMAGLPAPAGSAEKEKDKEKAEKKDAAVAAPAPSTPIPYEELPGDVRAAVRKEAGTGFAFEKTKTEEGADAFAVSFSRFGRQVRMLVAADGNVVKREELPTAAEVAEMEKAAAEKAAADKKAAEEAAAEEKAKAAAAKKPAAKKVPEKPVAKTPEKPEKPAAKTPEKPEKNVAKTPEKKGAAPAGAVSYARDVQPILSRACYNCHGNGQKKGGWDVQNALSQIISPGNPEGSMLYQALTGTGGTQQMPPRKKLSDAEINAVKTWISGGAKMN
jgi:mono/diheme cytochrome c family protein